MRPSDGTPKTWLNEFYSSSVAIPLSLVVLAAISRRADRQHAESRKSESCLARYFGRNHCDLRRRSYPDLIFLKNTVGFFQDEQVSFVQTPHHFYNPDVFQRNLQLKGSHKNEQALFYRVLQAGRDRHNTAFFAGSCGLFRRRVLIESAGSAPRP